MFLLQRLMAVMIFHTRCVLTSVQYLTPSLISRYNWKYKNNFLAQGISTERIHFDTETQFAKNWWPMCKTLTKISENQLTQLHRRYISRLPWIMHFHFLIEKWVHKLFKLLWQFSVGSDYTILVHRYTVLKQRQSGDALVLLIVQIQLSQVWNCGVK